jgi:thiol-disulfide isomerase/thioredoxin
MTLILAPEFRGSIRRYLVSPSPRAGVSLFILCLLAIARAEGHSQPSFAAEGRPHFTHVASPDCATAPFALTDLDGHERSLAAWKGRPLLVHFFATWCEPCKAEFGTLQRFIDARRDKFRLVAVSVGEVPGRVRSFLKETPVSFPVLLDADRSVTKAWAIDSLPSTILLDKSLRPILAVRGDLDWTSKDVGNEIDEAVASDLLPGSAGCTKEHMR